MHSKKFMKFNSQRNNKTIKKSYLIINHISITLDLTWLEVKLAADQPEQLTLSLPPCIPRKIQVIEK